MPTEVQFRRGTTAQNNSFTGAAGELSVNTTNNSLRVHDGTTAGGFELAKADLSNTTGLGTIFVSDVGIGVTIVISSDFELKNITSLDATTTATIESAVSAAPNNFTSLNISGIGTVIDTFNVGTGGTVLTALTQSGSSSVGIASAIPTATLDVFGTAKVSSTLTAGNSAVELSQSGINVTGIVTATSAKVGIVTVIDSDIFTPSGVITARSFSGELVGSAVTTLSTGIFCNSGVSTIAQIAGNITGQVMSGITTVDARLNVTGIATFNNSISFAGLSTFHQNTNFIDGVKSLFGNGGDLEIYHDGSNSYISDVGGGDLTLESNSLIRLTHSSSGIVTVTSYGLDIVGGTFIGLSGVSTFTSVKVGSAVTAADYGIDVAGGTHVGSSGITTVPQAVVGSAVTISSNGIDVLGETHIGVSGVATVPQAVVGSAVTISSSGIDILGGTYIGVSGVTTSKEVIVGAAVTMNTSGVVAGMGTFTSLNATNVTANEQLVVGASVTTGDYGIDVVGGTQIGALSGIITAPGGFITGVGQTTAMLIEFSGSNLVLTVVGIGSTTLPLTLA